MLHPRNWMIWVVEADPGLICHYHLRSVLMGSVLYPHINIWQWWRWSGVSQGHLSGCSERYLHGPLTRYVKLRVVHAPGMPGTSSPDAEFKGKRELAIPACITARASRTCRDACRDCLPAVAGKTFPAFPAHAHPQFYAFGKRPMQTKLQRPNRLISSTLILILKGVPVYIHSTKHLTFLKFMTTWYDIINVEKNKIETSMFKIISLILIYEEARSGFIVKQIMKYLHGIVTERH